MVSGFKKKKRFKFIRLLPFIALMIIILGVEFCLINVKPISKTSKKVVFEVEEGTSARTIINDLKKQGLIRNDLFGLVYYKINYLSKNESKHLNHGTYLLNKNMSLREIFDKLVSTTSATSETIVLTFHEGKNMRGFVKTITESTSITENDIYNTLNNKEYLKELMDSYWFLGDEILDSNIYYPLEGYLAPDTYEFNKDVTIKEIFKKLLDQEERILGKYKSSIDSSKYNTHEILTLASIAELEGKTLEDRKNIVGVFINRLNNNIPLGSDVTTYYAAKVDMGDRDLYQTEIDSSNLYNTRSMSLAGKLPVGPICNPSSMAIDAVINYKENDYFYFVADKNGKVYFTKTDSEHISKVNELKQKGLWFEY
ncbi:MAG: endolytic transglycosylase MltG [Bacilli bacterium]|nr:endolytic transglycosylase MltG [Bacilli bacterium]